MGYKHSSRSFSSGNADSLDTETSGGPGRMILASAMRLFGRLHAGLSMSLVGGGLEGSSTEIAYQSSKDVLSLERDFSASSMEIGASYLLSGNAGVIGLSYSPGYTLTDKWSSEEEISAWSDTDSDWGTAAVTSLKGERSITMPSSIGLGIQYNYRGLDRTMITADIKKTGWDSYRYEEKTAGAAGYGVKMDPGYRDTVRFSVGAEHYLSFTTALRTGFSYAPFYGATSADMVSFTCGGGMELANDLSIDIAGALGFRNYYGDNPFSSDDENVSESLVRLMATAEWNF